LRVGKKNANSTSNTHHISTYTTPKAKTPHYGGQSGKHEGVITNEIHQTTTSNHRSTKEEQQQTADLGLRLLVARGLLVSKALSGTLSNSVEDDFLLVEGAEGDEEDASDNPSGNSESAKHPCEPLLRVDFNESKIDGSRDGDLELTESHDNTLHPLGGLGEGVFEGSDGSKDLGHSNEDVGSGNDPHVKGRVELLFIGVEAVGRGVAVARIALVHEVHQDTSVEHSETGNDESSKDTLDRGEVDTTAAEEGVDDVVENGDHDDNGDRVQVLDEIVGSAVKGHSGSDGTEVTIDLRVAYRVLLDLFW